MIDLPPAFASHLQADATTLTYCFLVEKRNGEFIRGTMLDREVKITVGPYAGVYSPRLATFSTDATSKSDGSVSTLDLNGVFRVDAMLGDMKVAEIEAGLYDQARAVLLLVNWASPDDGQKVVMAGTLGEFQRDSDGLFKSEVRGLTQALSQQILRTYSPTCDVVRFGDARCGFNVASLTRTAVVTSVESRKRFALALSPLDLGEGPPEPPPNLNFEDGDTGWVFGGDGLGVIEEGETLEGTWRARLMDTGEGPMKYIETASPKSCAVGQPVTIIANVTATQFPFRTAARAFLQWRQTGGAPLGERVYSTSRHGQEEELLDMGLPTTVLPGGWANETWARLRVAGYAPAGATGWTCGVECYWAPDGEWIIDAFETNLFAGVAGTSYEVLYSGGILRGTSGANAGFERETKAVLVEDEIAQVLLHEELPADIEPGDTFELEPGCNRLPVTCRTIYQNLVNFRGYGIYAAGQLRLMAGSNTDNVIRRPFLSEEEQGLAKWAAHIRTQFPQG